MTPRKKLLFVSYHSLIDPASGAAVSVCDLLDALGKYRDWEIRSLTGPVLDFPHPVDVRKLLAAQEFPFETRSLRNGDAAFDLVGFRAPHYTGLSFLPPDPNFEPSGVYADTFVGIYDDLLDQWRPDVLLSYGGQSFMPRMFRAARQRGVRTVFTLFNFAYHRTDCFDGVDVLHVPSQYAAEVYRKRLGLETISVSLVMNEENILASTPPENRKYVTFVNPQPHKGVYVFARIAEILASKRPDIPLLVVESRAGSNSLLHTGLTLAQLSNVSVMRNTPCPGDIYGVSKIVLMPSLWDETFGRVAAEAMRNGIPVLASDRGSLPEICGDAGFVFPVSKNYTPETRCLISEKEAMPWIDTILRLHDDPIYYRSISQVVLAHATRWETNHLLDRYERVFLSTK